MQRFFVFFSVVVGLLASCRPEQTASGTKASERCGVECAMDKSAEMKCKLTSKELQERKAGVIAQLKQLVKEKKELTDGYAFKFPGDDATIDLLHDFIKTERNCCSFFVFGLSVSGNESEAWLSMTGREGVKEFIKSELEM